MRSRKFWIRLGLVLTAVWIVSAGLYWSLQLRFCGFDAALQQDPFKCMFLLPREGVASYLYLIADWLGLGTLGMTGNALAWAVLFPGLCWLFVILLFVAIQWVSRGEERKPAS